MPVLDLFGGRLHYETLGARNRPALILLHALGSSLAMWDAQAAALAAHFHVVRYSIRGHGESVIDAFCELDLDALARDALALLDELNITRAHWCGLSIGGMTAMWAAIHAPGRVERLVVASAVPHMPPRETWDERIEAALDTGLAPFAEPAMERWFTSRYRLGNGAEIDRMRSIFVHTQPEAYAACCAAVRDMDLRESLPRIRQPTLLISGDRDAAASPEKMRAMHEALAGSTFAVLPAAHLSNVECADDFTQAVIRHCASPPPPPLAARPA